MGCWIGQLSPLYDCPRGHDGASLFHVSGRLIPLKDRNKVIVLFVSALSGGHQPHKRYGLRVREIAAFQRDVSDKYASHAPY